MTQETAFMPIDTQYLFFFAMIGAFNGFLLSAYFWFKKPTDVANKFLALMLLMLSVRVFKSVILYFNPEVTKTFLQLGLSACFFIGPFLYFHMLARFQRFSWQNPWHKNQIFLLATVVLIVGITFPYANHEALWARLFYRVINLVWLFYIVAAALEMKPLWKKLIAKGSHLTRGEVISLSVFVGNLLIWLAFFTASYLSYILGAIIFSFLLYLTVLLLVFHRQDRPTRYANKLILPDEAARLRAGLQTLIEDEQLHLSPIITLPKLAARLNVSTPKLSQFLNDNLSVSFADFINEHRIESAKHRLRQDGKTVTLEQIAEECGYNSMSTFYASFKKVVGQTPAKFRDSVSPKS